MKTVCEADALVEFYVRDLLDWKAGLERLGFMPHHDKTGHLSLFVKLYRSLAVEGRRRKVSHLGVTAKPVESGPWPGTQFTKSTVRLSFDFKFGYPLTFPRFTVGFKNLLGVYYTSTHEICDDDSTLRRVLSWLADTKQFFASKPFDDIYSLQHFIHEHLSWVEAHVGGGDGGHLEGCKQKVQEIGRLSRKLERAEPRRHVPLNRRIARRT